MTANTPRTPLWNKSMARYLGQCARSTAVAATAETSSSKGTENLVPPHDPAAAIDKNVLARLGLKIPPTEPKLLAEFLQSEDAADGDIDADEFARGIRRAIRLRLAFSAKLHRQAGQTWTVWVQEHFKAGYECYQRYRRAAELQVGLASRGLPLLTHEHQARAIAPFRRHERFWDALAEFKHDFPAGTELKKRVCSALGLESLDAGATTRIKLHRALERIVAANAADNETVVTEALTLVRRAIAILAQGKTVP